MEEQEAHLAADQKDEVIAVSSKVKALSMVVADPERFVLMSPLQ